MNNYCPDCGGRVRYELGLSFLVCSVCSELLYINELVKKP